MIEYRIKIMGGDILEQSNEIGPHIKNLGLKKGDELFLWPFNSFSKEDSSFKGEMQFFHGKALTIEEYTVNICKSWNSSCKTIIDINLVINGE